MGRARSVLRVIGATLIVLLLTAIASPNDASGSAGKHSVLAWGWNSDGELGIGNTTDTTVPTLLKLYNVRQIATAGGYGYPPNPGSPNPAEGGGNTLALLDNGTVMAWGNNRSGQLGNGTTVSSDIPVPVPGLKKVTEVATNGVSSYALLSNGTVMAWGAYTDQFGMPHPKHVPSCSCQDTPIELPGLEKVKAIATGELHVMALLDDGDVMSWGNNGNGELGIGTFSAYSLSPVPVTGLAGVTALAAGDGNSYALLSDGRVMAWGGCICSDNLGDGIQGDVSDVPVHVHGLKGRVTAIAAGGVHAMALLANGHVMVWGSGNYGQLGLTISPTDTTQSASAAEVPGVAHVQAIAVGIAQSYVLLANGTAEAWGMDAAGELGNGETITTGGCDCQGRPVRVHATGSSTKITAEGSEAYLW